MEDTLESDPFIKKSNVQIRNSSINEELHSAINSNDQETKYAHISGEEEFVKKENNIKSSKEDIFFKKHGESKHSTDNLNTNFDESIKTGNEPSVRIQESSATTEESRVPDGGWGWFVALGAGLICMIFNVTNSSFSLLLYPALLDMGASTTTTAVIFNTFVFMWNISGIFTGTLTQVFGWRKVALFSTAICSLGIILSALKTSEIYLFVTYSLLVGTTAGLSVTLSFIILPFYFKKHRGKANSIMMAGVCLGDIFAPILIEYLQDMYAYKGATLIIGALMLNGVVGAALFQPLKWHLKPIKSPLLSQKDGKEVTVTDVKNNSTSPTSKQYKQKAMVLYDALKAAITNLKVLRSPAALIIALGNAVALVCWFNAMIMTTFSMVEKGHSLMDLAVCRAILGTTNLICRIILGFLSDKPWFNMKICYMSGKLICAVTFFIFTITSNLQLLWIVHVAFGIGISCYMNFFTLIMIQVMGMGKLKEVFGATCCLIAFSSLLIGVITGLIRDTSGSYTTTIWVHSAMIFFSFLLWIMMPKALKYQKNQDLNEEQKSEEHH